jgi:LysM repeat protein
MKKRTTAPARVFATIALLGAVVVAIVVISASLGGGDSTGSHSTTGQERHGGGAKKPTAKTYVVQNGDTLTAIAHTTGVSVARIQMLNPGVDPQILISGQRLKLR